MRQTKQQKWSGPRRLPIVRSGGVDYFVDSRLRQFRTAAPPTRHIEFIDFESVRGRRLLEECVTLECPVCGQQLVVSRDTNGCDDACGRCGAAAPMQGTW